KRRREAPEANYGVEGFDQIFEEQLVEDGENTGSTESGVTEKDAVNVTPTQSLERFADLVTVSIDQRAETAKIAAQLIENQRQLIATQQILIRLMERSIELTRHISSIEERLPTILELPRIVESLRLRLAHLEGIES